MPIGKGRRPAPPGYMTAAQAGEKLGQSRLYKFAQAGRLHRHTPPGQKHGYYLQSEVQAIVDAEEAFYGAKPESEIDDTDAVFALATPDDMDALVTLAKKLFNSTIDADRRREWIAKEPRGHYIVKKKSGEVVAYFYLQPLQHDKMIDYLEGRVYGWQITADDIETLEPGKHAEVMIGGIGSDPDVDQDTRSNYVAVLLRGIRRDLEQLGREGIIIDKIYSYSNTLDGIVMSLDLEMQQWKKPRAHKYCMFVLDIKNSNTFLLQGYKRGFKQYQRSLQEQRETPRKRSARQKPT